MKRAEKQKTKKRIRRNFSYRECGRFADFLHEQSLLGWHFKEWKMGLVFEKGEPADICYVVEVFPNGKEEDIKPNEDALDYAQYCEAAGWELLDGSAKFCIFRQKEPNAIPIVTEEEHFQNVYTAEWKKWKSRLWVILTWIGYFSFRYWEDFDRAIFVNLTLITVLFWYISLFVKLVEGVDLLWWKRKWQQSDTAFAASFLYKENGRKNWLGNVMSKSETVILVIALLLLLKNGVYSYALTFVLPIYGIVLVIIVIMSVLLSWFRPERDINEMIQFGVSALLVVIAMAAMVAVSVSEKTVVMEEPPLVQGDYRDMQGEPMEVQESFHLQSPFGKVTTCKIIYGEEPKYEEKITNDDGTTVVTKKLQEGSKEQDKLQYELYECNMSEIVAPVWKRVAMDWDWCEDCTELWGAEEAKTTGRIYFVRYEKKILQLISDVELNQEQIEIIREKLELE